MTPGELELLRTVFEDLKYLSKEWTQWVEDDDLRRSSNVLRVQLVDGNYGRAWRLLGLPKEPTIVATDLSLFMGTIPQERIVFAQAGGARSRNIDMRFFFEISYAISNRERECQEEYSLFRTVYKMTEYLRSVSFIVKGSRISRREVIKYVANKLGGTHFDISRNRKGDDTFILLDQIRKTYTIAERPAVNLELLAIGQSVVKAPDTKIFLEKAAAALERSDPESGKA